MFELKFLCEIIQRNSYYDVKCNINVHKNQELFANPCNLREKLKNRNVLIENLLLFNVQTKY